MSRLSRFFLAVGGMDVFTGLLLVLGPGFTLGLMGLGQQPTEPVFLSWIGVFVASVGACYWLPYLVDPQNRKSNIRFSLAFTAMARLLVGSFVAVKVATGNLESGWLLVSLADLGLGLVQIVVLARRTV